MSTGRCQQTASQAFDKILTHNKTPGIFSVPTLMKIFCNALPARQLQKIGPAKKVLKTARPGPALRGRAIRIAKVLLTKKLSTADLLIKKVIHNFLFINFFRWRCNFFGGRRGQAGHRSPGPFRLPCFSVGPSLRNAPTASQGVPGCSKERLLHLPSSVSYCKPADCPASTVPPKYTENVKDLLGIL